MKRALLILGSGATSGSFETETGRELPTDQGFFSASVVTEVFNQETFPALHFFANLQKVKSLEKTWSDIDLASKLTNSQLTKQRIISMQHDYEGLQTFFEKKALNDSPFRNNLNSQLSWVGEGGCIGPMASWEAVQLVLKIYGKIKEKEQSTLSTVLESILKNSDLKGVMTFNYDCSVESVWHKVATKKKIYYYDPDHASGYENGIPMYKMHGSINWCSTFEPKERWKYEIPTDVNATAVSQEYRQGKFIDGTPEYIKEPTIIAPDLFKQNITLDIQNDPKSTLFKRIWNRVWEKLEEIDVLIFIGFSFPDTDHHAKFLFTTADRRKPFTNVILNTAREASTALSQYQSLFHKDKVKHIWGGIQGLTEKKADLISYLK